MASREDLEAFRIAVVEVLGAAGFTEVLEVVASLEPSTTEGQAAMSDARGFLGRAGVAFHVQ